MKSHSESYEKINLNIYDVTMKDINPLMNELILIYRKLINQNEIKHNLNFKCIFSHNNETRLIYLAIETKQINVYLNENIKTLLEA